MSYGLLSNLNVITSHVGVNGRAKANKNQSLGFHVTVGTLVTEEHLKNIQIKLVRVIFASEVYLRGGLVNLTIFKVFPVLHIFNKVS